MQGIRLQRAPNFLWIYAGTTGEGGQVKGVRVLLFKPFKVWSFDICVQRVFLLHLATVLNFTKLVKKLHWRKNKAKGLKIYTLNHLRCGQIQKFILLSLKIEFWTSFGKVPTYLDFFLIYTTISSFTSVRSCMHTSVNQPCARLTILGHLIIFQPSRLCVYPFL